MPGDRPSLTRFIADAAPELLGAGVAGALQAAGADPVTGGLTGTAIGLALRFDRQNWQHAVGRAAYITRLAADAVGGEDELERLATADDYRRELTARVLRAAARTPIAEKLPALARVLADTLTDQTPVDEALLLAAALDDLERPHIRALQYLGDQPSHVVALHAQDFEHLFPNHELVLANVLQVLVRHGLAETVGLDGGDASDPLGDGFTYAGTPLGRRCLDLLRDN